MGRKPKPTATKRLAGNPGQRKLNPAEPTPQAILPPAPADLTDVGRAKWNETALKLYNQSIVTELDLDMLYMYCVEWETFIEARNLIKANGGMVLKTSNGNPIQNPYVSIANQCKDKMIKIMTEFGMSPASRSRVSTVQKAKPKSLAEKFFNAPIAIDKGGK